MSKVRKITLFIPSYRLGGLELLYIRVSIELVQRGYEISIVDYIDGVVNNYLKKAEISYKYLPYNYGDNLINIYNKKKTTHVDMIFNDTVVVLSLKYLPYVRYFFSGNAKFFFWDEHPNNIIGYLRTSWLLNKYNNIPYKAVLYSKNIFRFIRAKRLLNRAMQLNGVMFMTKSNFELINNVINLKINPEFLPIPIHNKDICISNKRSVTANEINALYVGRLDEDKKFLPQELIEDVLVHNLSNSPKVFLHIVGDGSAEKSLKANFGNSNFIIFHGSKYGHELDTFINENIDISFGVGTSALETAILNIPTVFQRSSESRHCNKYIWIFDSEFYELSLTEALYNCRKEYVFGFTKIMKQYLEKGASFGTQSASYVKKNHSMEFVSSELIKAISNTELTLKELK